MSLHYFHITIGIYKGVFKLTIIEIITWTKDGIEWGRAVSDVPSVMFDYRFIFRSILFTLLVIMGRCGVEAADGIGWGGGGVGPVRSLEL